ncbi:MAG: hypothetical protein BGO69_05485 [Bacteroidetes bacterium 46-16]|nr:MAG: hypothetical protein BGO69_05485 [Bacteroidetes bacterium 46-16]
MTKEQAIQVIREVKKYPHVFEHDVNTTDAVAARSLLDAGLEADGIVTIDKTQKLKDICNPIIHFTDKAKPFLIREDPKYNYTQVVKIADVDLGEVTAIRMLEDKKSATVEYTVVHKNITPFAKLINKDMTRPDTLRVELALFDTGWKLDKSRY